MGDAFQGSQAMAAAVNSQGYGIAIVLPNIPLWVPEAAKRLINDLTLSTTRLALHDATGYIADAAGHSSDTGHLAQSFGADPATSEGGQEVIGNDVMVGITGRVFSSLPYAIVIDQGRRPGAPISRAGIDAIGLWAQRKLGLSADEANGAKWGIAASIVAQGISGTGYFEEGTNKARPRIQFMFDKLAERISTQLATEGQGQSGTGTA